MPRAKRVATMKVNDENSQPSKTKLNKKISKRYANTGEDKYQRKRAGNLTRPRSLSPESTCIKNPKESRLYKSLRRAVDQYAFSDYSNEPSTFDNRGSFSTCGLVTPEVKPNTPSVMLSRPKQGEMATSTYGLVTPKVKPNTSSIVLRRSIQGEMATSMQGSPLMVGSVINENVANVTIPFRGGIIRSIHPNPGLRISEPPLTNEELRREMFSLFEDLQWIL